MDFIRSDKSVGLEDTSSGVLELVNCPHMFPLSKWICLFLKNNNNPELEQSIPSFTAPLEGQVELLSTAWTTISHSKVIVCPTPCTKCQYCNSDLQVTLKEGCIVYGRIWLQKQTFLGLIHTQRESKPRYKYSAQNNNVLKFKAICKIDTEAWRGFLPFSLPSAHNIVCVCGGGCLKMNLVWCKCVCVCGGEYSREVGLDKKHSINCERWLTWELSEICALRHRKLRHKLSPVSFMNFSRMTVLTDIWAVCSPKGFSIVSAPRIHSATPCDVTT